MKTALIPYPLSLIPYPLSLIPLLSGCSLFTSGWDTRTAAEARSTTTWGADGNLLIDEATTHNRRVFTAESTEGGTVLAAFDSEGNPTSIEGASQILWQKSEPKDVMQAYTQLAIQNARVAERMFGAIEKLTEMVAPIVAQRTARPPPSTQPTVIDRILDRVAPGP
jgi:hypothetical protein